MYYQLICLLTLLPLTIHAETLAPQPENELTPEEQFAQSAQSAETLLRAKKAMIGRSASFINPKKLAKRQQKAETLLAAHQEAGRHETLAQSRAGTLPKPVNKAINNLLFGTSEIPLPGADTLLPHSYIELADSSTRRVADITTFATEEPIHELFDSAPSMHKTPEWKKKREKNEGTGIPQLYRAMSHTRNNAQEVFDRFDGFHAVLHKVANRAVWYTTATQTEPQLLDEPTLEKLLNSGTNFDLFESMAKEADANEAPAYLTKIEDQEDPAGWIKHDTRMHFDFMNDRLFVRKPQFNALITALDEVAKTNPLALAFVEGLKSMDAFGGAVKTGMRATKGIFDLIGIKLDSKLFLALNFGFQKLLANAINEAKFEQVKREVLAAIDEQVARRRPAIAVAAVNDSINSTIAALKKFITDLNRDTCAEKIREFMSTPIESATLPVDKKPTTTPQGYLAVDNPFNKYALLCGQKLCADALTNFFAQKESFMLLTKIEGKDAAQTEEQYKKELALIWYELNEEGSQDIFVAAPAPQTPNQPSSLYYMDGSRFVPAQFCTIVTNDEVEALQKNAATEQALYIPRLREIVPATELYKEGPPDTYEIISKHYEAARFFAALPDEFNDEEQQALAHRFKTAGDYNEFIGELDLAMRIRIIEAILDDARRIKVYRAGRRPGRPDEIAPQNPLTASTLADSLDTEAGLPKPNETEIFSEDLHRTDLIINICALLSRTLYSAETINALTPGAVDKLTRELTAIGPKVAARYTNIEFLSHLKKTARGDLATGLSTLPDDLIWWYEKLTPAQLNIDDLKEKTCYGIVRAGKPDLTNTENLYILRHKAVQKYNTVPLYLMQPLDEVAFLNATTERLVVTPAQPLEILSSLSNEEGITLTAAALLAFMPSAAKPTAFVIDSISSMPDDLEELPEWAFKRFKHPYAAYLLQTPFTFMKKMLTSRITSFIETEILNKIQAKFGITISLDPLKNMLKDVPLSTLFIKRRRDALLDTLALEIVKKLIEAVPGISDAERTLLLNTLNSASGIQELSTQPNLQPFAQPILDGITTLNGIINTSPKLQFISDPIETLKTWARDPSFSENNPLPDMVKEIYESLVQDPEDFMANIQGGKEQISKLGAQLGVIYMRPLVSTFYTDGDPAKKPTLNAAPVKKSKLRPIAELERDGLKQLMLKKQPDGSYKALTLTEKRAEVAKFYAHAATIKEDKVKDLEKQLTALKAIDTDEARTKITALSSILEQLKKVDATAPTSVASFVAALDAACMYPALHLKKLSAGYDSFIKTAQQLRFALLHPEQKSDHATWLKTFNAQAQELLTLVDATAMPEADKTTMKATIENVQKALKTPSPDLHTLDETIGLLTADVNTLLSPNQKAAILFAYSTHDAEALWIDAAKKASDGIFITAPQILNELRPLSDTKASITPSYQIDAKKVGLHAVKMAAAGKIAQLFLNDRTDFITEAILDNPEALNGLLSAIQKRSPEKTKNILTFLDKKCTYVPFKFSLHGSMKHVLVWLLFYELVNYLESTLPGSPSTSKALFTLLASHTTQSFSKAGSALNSGKNPIAAFESSFINSLKTVARDQLSGNQNMPVSIGLTWLAESMIGVTINPATLPSKVISIISSKEFLDVPALSVLLSKNIYAGAYVTTALNPSMRTSLAKNSILQHYMPYLRGKTLVPDFYSAPWFIGLKKFIVAFMTLRLMDQQLIKQLATYIADKEETFKLLLTKYMEQKATGAIDPLIQKEIEKHITQAAKPTLLSSISPLGKLLGMAGFTKAKELLHDGLPLLNMRTKALAIVNLCSLGIPLLNATGIPHFLKQLKEKNHGPTQQST
ncbi:MAG: hypothetical protein QG604_679 [Candidatus Dependentiae bacterium]|nr:hypothetical protein [Candidatus Dependentiae bacterium]